MNVSLNYHRRHGLNCEGKHLAGTYTGDSEERKKGWKRCRCLIYASGSLNRVAKRFATKRTDWQEARELMAPYIAANRWDVLPDLLPTDGGEKCPATVTSTTVEEACQAYVKAKEGRRVTKSTMAKYRTFTGQLLTFTKEKGCTGIAQITVTDLDEFYAGWKGGPNSIGKKLERMKDFFSSASSGNG